jgi:hypothetical protein
VRFLFLLLSSLPSPPSDTFYYSDYKPELAKIVAEREAKKEATKADSISKLMRDMQVSGDGKKAKVPQSALDKYLGEGADDSEEDDEGEVIDKSAFYFSPLLSFCSQRG